MRNIPKVMLQLGVTQFFSWAALFLMWTYLKPAITGVVTDPVTGEVLSAGATQTWVGVLNGIYPIPACIASIFLSRIAARYGNKAVYAACLLCGALGFGGLLLVHNQYLMMLPMVGIGIAWAGILAMPYSILSRDVHTTDSHRPHWRPHSQMDLRLAGRLDARPRGSVHAAGRSVHRFCG